MSIIRLRNEGKEGNSALIQDLNELSLFTQKTAHMVATEYFKEERKYILNQVFNIPEPKGATANMLLQGVNLKTNMMDLLNADRNSKKTSALSTKILKSTQKMVSDLKMIDATDSLMFALSNENMIMRKGEGNRNDFEIKRRWQYFEDKTSPSELRDKIVNNGSKVLSDLKVYYQTLPTENEVNDVPPNFTEGMRIGREINTLTGQLHDLSNELKLSYGEPGLEEKSISKNNESTLSI